MKIEYSEITVEKITKDIFIAKCTATKPRRIEIEMKGKSEVIARKKLELFLQNKPYKHLDSL